MKKVYFFTFIILFSHLVIAADDEYFGEFLDKLKGEFIIEATPRPKFKLEEEFRFKDPNGLMWVVPQKKEVDGASIPQAFWSIIGGPFAGKYINASVIHDYYCNVKTRTAHDTHRVFYYAMKAANVSNWKAKFMYWAVSTFGPNWKITKKVLFNNICIGENGMLTCKQVPKLVESVEVIPSLDLTDPAVLTTALNEAQSVAHTLKNSNGEILNTSFYGEKKLASLDAIKSSSDSYRTNFVTKDFIANLEQNEIIDPLTQLNFAQDEVSDKAWLYAIKEMSEFGPDNIENGVGEFNMQLTPY